MGRGIPGTTPSASAVFVIVALAQAHEIMPSLPTDRSLTKKGKKEISYFLTYIPVQICVNLVSFTYFCWVCPGGTMLKLTDSGIQI